MSSAAMQAIPHNSPSLGSHQTPPSPASARQYHQQRPHSRDVQSNQQTPNPGASPSSSRRAQGRSGGTDGSPALTTTPQQTQFYSSTGSSPAGSNATTPRNNPLPSSNRAAPTSQPSDRSPAGRTGETSLEIRGGPPIAPPPRTSSNQLNQNTASSSPPVSAERASSSRKPSRSADEVHHSPRHINSSGGRDGEDLDSGSPQASVSDQERDRTKVDNASAAATAARARRKNQQSPREERPQRSSSNRESRPRQSPRVVPSNSATTAGSETRPTVSREGSAVINRVVVTDPQVDLVREQERMAEAQPSAPSAEATPVTGLGLVGSEGAEDGGRGGGKSRQNYASSSSRRKETKFGEYILGQTLGEGEFGKVKMGWKKDGGVQVAIKLIRRESLGSNPSRLPKIYREISILRELSHPNIVRLHEMVETDRHIGIILEYASGGELFDYILNQRYLKDHAARRLFAQLVSGVGYLHKKGIVHRDLKLENLLLDRNRNIIITDFGFANTFDPVDELGDEIEYNLGNRDFVKKMDLERYAMLAGYLPFDDDPANPEGDNINLLYKYIVTTPLTFPEYVTPHARDLLRRILVPDPRKRADLFEVARHSWLSEYAHVVSFITSSTTTTGEIANATVSAEDRQETSLLTRSASVREPSKSHQPYTPAVGGLSQKHGNVDQDVETSQPKTQRDAKRRTVQVEYVAPQSQTTRGEPSSPTAGPGASKVLPESAHKTSGRSGGQGTADVSKVSAGATTRKPLPQEPQDGGEARQSHKGTSAQSRSQQRPQSSSQGMAPPSRPVREVPRSVSESAGAFGNGTGAGNSIARPNTGGSMTSTGSMTGSMNMASRGSYYRPGQPVAPTVATMNAQGRLAQPKNGKKYVISDPIPQTDDSLQPSSFGRPSSSTQAPRFSHRSPSSGNSQPSRAHKRSNTVGGIGEKIFGRSGSIFGRPSSHAPPDKASQQQKSYPPTSMPGPIASGTPRQSTDSRRSSFGFSRKASGSQEKSRRFSLLPASFSLKNFGGGASSKEYMPPTTAESGNEQADFAQPPPPIRTKAKRPSMAFGRGLSQAESVDTSDSAQFPYEGAYDAKKGSARQDRKRAGPTSNPQQQAYQKYPSDMEKHGGENSGYHAYASGPGDSALTTESESSLNMPPSRAPYPPGFNTYDEEEPPQQRWGRGPGVLQKSNRKFVDAYEQEPERRFTSSGGQNSGSSGAARKVMDFFRRRGKARTGDDR
ncbi:MAG: hypothetical protein M1833_003708 [Piccolia ochrophora]|nr:MAG: hypothetical protein M1833_003708 [Piccolia ochrophora]